MGTCESYGGSSSTTWQKARDGFDGLGAGGAAGDGPGDGGVDTPSPPHDDSAAATAAAIAAALLADDPDARRPTTTFPISSLLPSRRGSGGGGAGAGGAGRTSSGGRSGGGSSRQVARGAARGGAAIGGAYALRAGDAAGLRELGLDLAELSALPPKVQLARIVDATLGDAGHPDDYALKRATIEHMKMVLLAEVPPTPEVSMRSFVAAWIFQLSLVELRSQRTARNLTARQVANAERQLQDWLKRRVERIPVTVQGPPSVKNLADTARTIASEALRLIKAVVS